MVDTWTLDPTGVKEQAVTKAIISKIEAVRSKA